MKKLLACLLALALLASSAGAQTIQSPGPSVNPIGAPAYVTGASMWYSNPYITGAPGTGTTGTANSYYCTPFWIWQPVTIKGLGIRVVGTSTGNSSAALQGAVYYDLVTTGNLHRPGTLINYTASFATGSAVSVSAAMNNTTDLINGPGLIWTCVQKFDATATFAAAVDSFGNLANAVIGSSALASVIGLYTIGGVLVSGTGYGGSNWVNFSGSTGWTEMVNNVPQAPVVVIEVN